MWDGLRSTSHGLFYAIMGALVVAFFIMGVIAAVGHDRTTYWGTFTEQSTQCDPGPRGACTIMGRWVSEDQSIVKEHIQLDGNADKGESVRASYQPGGPMGDDANNIVHTPFFSGAGLWFPWVGAALCVAAIWHYRRTWQRDARSREWRGRHRTQDDPD